MRKSTIIIVVFFTIAVVTVSAQTIRHVPSQYKTIQAAINAASNNDTVIVAPKVYLENIDFKGKSIKLQSSHGPGLTIIDGGMNGSTVTIRNCSGTPIIDGFTITRGLTSTHGGGIFCLGCSPIIRNNDIYKNAAHPRTGHGGGIYCSNSSARIEANKIYENSASSGGGIFCSSGKPFVFRNTIYQNQSVSYVGAGGAGGGIVISHSNATVCNNVISFNSAPGDAGGIECNGTSTTTVTVTNNTIYGNSAGSKGGGIHCWDAAVIVTNNILWANWANNGPEISVELTKGSVSISYSCVQGGRSSVSGATINWGTGMISTSPSFQNPVQGDLHLTLNSSCKDKGSNNAPSLPSWDFEGDIRIAPINGVVDIGADEYFPHLYTTGRIYPGYKIKLNVVGASGSQVLIGIGTSVLPAPILIPGYGNLYISPPIALVPLGNIPSSGIVSWSVKIPFPYTIPSYIPPFQALVLTSGGGQLTNLEIVYVR